jgi:metal-responsive CopG/Arc/MetJ family transcriptional regulator
MTNVIWYVNARRQALLDAMEDIPEYGRRKRSEIIEMALKEFIEKHAKSNNPQSQLEHFDNETIRCVPNVYRDEEEWKKFYNLMKSEADYKELDEKINMINNLHSRKFKEFR